jgi:hypothetical protein
LTCDILIEGRHAIIIGILAGSLSPREPARRLPSLEIELLQDVTNRLDALSECWGVNTVDDKPEPINSAEQALNTLFTLKAINLLEKKFENLSLDINSKFNALTRDVNDSREIERQ